MNILITGTKGLAEALGQLLSQDNHVTCVSKSNGYNIADVMTWGPKFYHYDVCINCCYDTWHQVGVLEQFYYAWQNDSSKQIINIGSIISDYTRTNVTTEHEYLAYRVHKQALQTAFNKLSRSAKCDVKLINPGAIDTDMIKHMDCVKMSPEWLAVQIKNIMSQSWLKRVDLWQ
jgi:NAD(P)-dependent dehydrogenase (short-subunit alcohol dehydrogenase family)